MLGLLKCGDSLCVVAAAAVVCHRQDRDGVKPFVHPTRLAYQVIHGLDFPHLEQSRRNWDHEAIRHHQSRTQAVSVPAAHVDDRILEPGS